MAKTPDSAEPKPITSFGKLYNLIRERWPEYVLEVIVIIVSITLSFAFDEWKDNRQKKELEQTYLKGLYSDMEADSVQLQEIITETNQILQRTSGLAKLNAQSTEIRYDQFISDVRFIFKRPRFVAEDATFADLKSTGNMQVISNFSLKRLLFEYHKHYEVLVLVEAAELETTNTVVAPYLLQQLSLGGNPDPIQKAFITSYIGGTGFQNMLLLRRSTRQELLQNYQESLQLSQKILALVRAQMN